MCACIELIQFYSKARVELSTTSNILNTMRVLIVFALIGACFADEFLAPLPLGYSSLIVDQPKPSYEYSTSVNTPTYNNFAHVRSGGSIERKIYNFPTAPLIAAEPILPATKFISPIPVVKTVPNYVATNYEIKPVANFEAKPITQFRSDGFLTTKLAAVPAPVVAPLVKAEPIVQPVYPAFPSYFRYAPSIIAETKPAEIVNTVVENKVVGEGILERKSQYHSQNELGEATYGHRDQFQSHDAVQDAAGNKAGSFSYIAPDGRLLTTEYIADQNGYRVASNALPKVEKLLPIEIEKPIENASSEEIVVEAKSRSRRSVAPLVAAPVVTSPVLPVTRSLPLYAAPRVYYQNPYVYSSYYPYTSYYSEPLLSRSYYYQFR